MLRNSIQSSSKWLNQASLTSLSSIVMQKSFSTAGMPSFANVDESSSSDKVHDIVLVGSGMVGSALACAIAKKPMLSDMSVVWVDPLGGFSSKLTNSSEKGERDGLGNARRLSNRVSSLTPGTISFLKELGVWQHIEQTGRYKSFTRMEVWEGSGSGSISFDARDIGLSTMGYIVENDVVQDAFGKALSSRIPVLKASVSDIILPATNSNPADVESIEEDSHWIKCKLSNGQTLKSKLLIGADGHNSVVRKAGKFESMSWDYGQSGVVATLNVECGSANLCHSKLFERIPSIARDIKMGNQIAWQRFLYTGPIALLPLTESNSSLVWSTERGIAESLLRLSDEQFVDALNTALRAPIADVRALMDYLRPKKEIKQERSPNGEPSSTHLTTEFGPLVSGAASLASMAAAALFSTAASLVQSSSFLQQQQQQHQQHQSDLFERKKDDSFLSQLNSNEALSNIGKIVNSVGSITDGIISTLSGTGNNASFGQNLVTPPGVIGIQSGSRAAFPLGFMHSSQYVRSRLALIGDAAHRVHPLAGQGVNLGFSDVQRLTTALEQSVRTGQDIGWIHQLLPYERESQMENFPTMLAIDTINRLFSNDLGILALIRGSGLSATDSLVPLKNLFIKIATKA